MSEDIYAVDDRMAYIEETKDAIDLLHMLYYDCDNSSVITLQSSYLIEGWLNVMDRVEGLVCLVESVPIFSWATLEEELKYKLSLKTLSNSFSRVSSLFIGCCNETISALKTDEKEWLSESQIESLLKKDYLEAGKNEDFLKGIKAISKSVKEDSLKNLESIKGILEEFCQFGEHAFSKIVSPDSDLEKLVRTYLFDYCNEKKNAMLVSLKNEATELKDKNYAKLADSPEAWGKLIHREKEDLELAKKRQLTKLKTRYSYYLSHWAKEMNKSSLLMEGILSLYEYEGLFDLQNAFKKPIDLLHALTASNVVVFAEIFLRYNLIRCELFPELRKSFENWINPKAQNVSLSRSIQMIHKEVKEYFSRVDWKFPATKENAALFVDVLFGLRADLLDVTDLDVPDRFMGYVTSRRCKDNTPAAVVSANIIGFLLNDDLVFGTPQTINDTVFKPCDLTNSINQGKKVSSNAFRKMVPFLDRCRMKIIG